jgi:hypothetical protein
MAKTNNDKPTKEQENATNKATAEQAAKAGEGTQAPNPNTGDKGAGAGTKEPQGQQGNQNKNEGTDFPEDLKLEKKVTVRWLKNGPAYGYGYAKGEECKLPVSVAEKLKGKGVVTQ